MNPQQHLGQDINSASLDDDGNDSDIQVISTSSPPVTPFSSTDLGSTDGGDSPPDPELADLRMPDRWPVTAAEDDVTHLADVICMEPEPEPEVGEGLPDKSPKVAVENQIPDATRQPPGLARTGCCDPLPEWLDVDDDHASLDEAEVISSLRTDFEATDKAIAAAESKTEGQHEVSSTAVKNHHAPTAAADLKSSPRAKSLWSRVARRQRANSAARQFATVLASEAAEQTVLYGHHAVQADADPKQVEKKSCMVDPHGRLRYWWDVAQLLLLSYVGVTVPYCVALEKEPEPGSFLFWLELCVDLYFFIDIILNFRTRVELKHSEDKDDTYIVGEPREIAAHYTHCCGPACQSSCRKGQRERRSNDLQVLDPPSRPLSPSSRAERLRATEQHRRQQCRPPGWFWIDIVSCIPLYSYISGNRDTQAVRLLRLLRFLKLLRVLRIQRILARLEVTDLWHKFVSGYKTVGIFFVMLYLVHFVACMWLLAGTQEGEVANQTVVGWVDRMHPATTDLEKYLTAFHAVNPKIASIGEGNLVARTNSEVVLSIFLELVCGIYFGYLAGVMGSIFGSKSQMKHIRDQKQQELREFLTAKNIPSDLRNSVRDHFNHMYKKETGFDEQNLLAALPPALKYKLLMQMHERDIKDVILFKHLGEDVKYELCLRLKPFQASPGEQIMKQGDLAREMFIITKGRVRLEKDKLHLGNLGSGAYFGEICIIEAAVQLGVGRAARASACATRSRSAWAVDRSDLCYLTREDVLQLMGEYEDLRLSLIKFQLKKKRIERKRTRTSLRSIKPRAQSDGLADLHEDACTALGDQCVQNDQNGKQTGHPQTALECLPSADSCSLERVKSAEQKFLSATVRTVAPAQKRTAATSEKGAKVVPIISSSSMPIPTAVGSAGSVNVDDIVKVKHSVMREETTSRQISDMQAEIAKQSAATKVALERQQTMIREALTMQSEEIATLLGQILRSLEEQRVPREVGLERQRTLTGEAPTMQRDETTAMLRQILRSLEEQRALEECPTRGQGTTENS